ncbi:MAG: recombinase family protein [Clostridia bacterium]|nr:recombinase family protein [Clostridia bacterium]
MQTATATPPKRVHYIPAKPELTSAAMVKRTLRVAAYCRVSTKKDEQHLSYEAQQTVYTDRIMSNPEWQMVGIYADKGITGTIAAKRPGFMKLMKDCTAGKIDIVLTKSMQRFARNTLDSVEYWRKLKSMGVGIIFETQGLDTRKMTDEMMYTFFASIAQNESETISTNVRWGNQRSFEKGKVRFAYKVFLGYQRGADGKPEIVQEEAAIIQRIYSEFLSGFSTQDIAARLTANGVLTAKGWIHGHRRV